MTDRLACWARAVKRDVFVLWLAGRDPRVPWSTKLVAALVASYALSPIDLIPDFIPILGQLDDLILVPLGIALAIRLISPDLLEEFREQAVACVRPPSLLGIMLIVATWLAFLLGAAAVWSERF